MRKCAVIIMVLFVGLCFAGYALASEKASKDEVIAKCKAAADMIKKGKDAAIAEIAKKDGKFVWKDTYVFLVDLKGKALAHPIKPALTKRDTLLGVPDKNTAKPKMIFVEFDKVAKSDKGQGWVDYMWPKKGEDKPSKKNTFIYKVPGEDMYVGAGIYE